MRGSLHLILKTGVALSAQHSFTALGPLPRWCGSEYVLWAISFGPYISQGVLIAHKGLRLSSFESRIMLMVSRLLASISAKTPNLSRSQTFRRRLSYAWGLAEGLGSVEFDTTAYPGICLVDQNCWGNAHGQTYQWFRTPDTSSRAEVIYGDNPPLWDFAHHQRSDIVIINLGTNDNNTHNNVTSSPQVSESSDYIDLLVEWIQPTQRYRPEVQADTLYWNDEPNY
ncbi:hypothetical protein KCU87_g208, partial [Aureobasidium melanogenum]